MPLILFTPPARAELINAQDWYEKESPGLGRHFRAAVKALIERMIANPGSSQSFTGASAELCCATILTQ